MGETEYWRQWHLNHRYDEYDAIPQAELKRRGWTPRLIEEFFPKPTRVKESRRWKNTIRLYDKRAVRAIEHSDEFQKAQAAEKAEKAERAESREAAKRDYNRIHDEIFEGLDGLQIMVPVLEWDDLVRAACDRWNAKGRRPPADVAKAVLEFLREHLTFSNPDVQGLIVAHGDAQERRQLSDMILDACVAQYPQLA